MASLSVFPRQSTRVDQGDLVSRRRLPALFLAGASHRQQPGTPGRRGGSVVSSARPSWRLPEQPGEVIDRSRTFTFSWNGEKYQAHPGDTIASALAAAGVRVFSRSYKYHRPRGLLTADIFDPGCQVQVGDEPNVRGAHRLAVPGLDVRSQNTWPSLKHDVKAVNRLVGRF